MNRHSLFMKLFLGNLLIVGIIITAAGVVAYHSLNAEYRAETEAYQDQLTAIALQYVERSWPLSVEQADRLCKQFLSAQAAGDPAHGLPMRLTVIDLDGKVLGDSQGNPAKMSNHKTPDRPEVVAALEGRHGVDVRRSETLTAEYRYVAMTILHNGYAAGAVRVSMPVVAIVHREEVVRHAVIWTVAAAIAAFAFMGLLINYFLYVPLKRITEAARRIAAGDLEHRARMPRSGELADLALALNEMRENLAAQIGTVTAQRESLAQIVANLGEGVIAVDAGGRIVLANKSATDLLAQDGAEAAGRRLDAVVRAADIVDAYNAAVAAGKPVTRDITIEVQGRRRSLDLVVSPTAAASGAGVAALVVVHDVTDIVQTAAIKAEFVANASHELRTPLATVRAAVDSLAATDLGDRESIARMVAMLDRHVRRLEALTADLLDLHALESGRLGAGAEEITLGSLADWARGQFAARAAEKGLALEFDVAAPGETFRSDRQLVELILRNLIDNAVKFTPAGGRVDCQIRYEGNAAHLRVADTGCGIRREDQPRVFERFFQADAARSGDAQARGTGLGLAIVKHACDRLGGTVKIESEPGRGTTVTVVVPDRSDGKQ